MAENENPVLKRAITTLRDALAPEEIQALSHAIHVQVTRARDEDYSDVLTDLENLSKPDVEGSMAISAFRQ